MKINILKNLKQIIRKKHLILLIQIFMTCMINFQTVQPIFDPNGQAPDFDELFKNIDMDKMLKDLEDVFGLEETSKKKAAEIKQPPRFRRATVQKRTPETQTKTIQEKPTTETKKKNKQTLFLEDFEISQEAPKLPKEKHIAYNSIMKELTDKLNSIQNRIDSFEFGIALKEIIEDIKIDDDKNYKDIITQIKIAKDAIGSKQIFLRIFFSKEYNDSRKTIISLLNEIIQIEQSKKIKISTLERLFKKLSPTTIEISKIEKSEEAQKKIEEKIRKRIENAKKLKAESQKYRSRRGRQQSWGRGRSGMPSPWYPPKSQQRRGRGYDTSGSRYHDPFESKFNSKHKSTKPLTKSDDKQKSYSGGKEKKEVTKIINLINKITKKLKTQISKLFEKQLPKEKQEESLYNDERGEKILQTNLFEEINSEIKEIERTKEKLAETEVTRMEKTHAYTKAFTEFKNTLNIVMTPVIKSCKYVFEEEAKNKEIVAHQKAALTFFEQQIKSSTFNISLEQKANKSLSDYEKRLLNLITREFSETIGQLQFSKTLIAPGDDDDDEKAIKQLQEVFQKRNQQILALSKTNPRMAFEQLGPRLIFSTQLRNEAEELDPQKLSALLLNEIKSSEIEDGKVTKLNSQLTEVVAGAGAGAGQAKIIAFAQKIFENKGKEIQEDFNLLSNRLPLLHRLNSILQKQPTVQQKP